MSRITIISILCLAAAAQAALADVDLATGKVTQATPGEENTVTYLAGTDRVTIAGVDHPLVLLKDRGIIVNENCAHASENGCMALKALDLLSTRKRVTGTQTKWGRRTGAVLCEQTKGGLVIVGNDPKHNELAVCYFEDSTFILLDSLATFYRSQRHATHPRVPAKVPAGTASH